MYVFFFTDINHWSDLKLSTCGFDFRAKTKNLRSAPSGMYFRDFLKQLAPILLLAVKIQKSSVLEKQNSIRRKIFAHKRIKEINIKWKKKIRFHCIIQIIWQINLKGHKVCNSTCNGIFDSYVRVRKKENKMYCAPEVPNLTF